MSFCLSCPFYRYPNESAGFVGIWVIQVVKVWEISQAYEGRMGSEVLCTTVLQIPQKLRPKG